MAIQLQPKAGQGPVPGAPADLHILAGLDTLVVKKKIEMIEVVLGCETKNRYHIFDAQEQELFRAKEDTDWCTRQVCGQARPVELPIRDLEGREVLHITRPYRCQACCFPCYLQEAQVSLAESGMGLGSVEQEWSCLLPNLVVKDQAGSPVFRISLPNWCVCCDDLVYKVWSEQGGEEVASITRKWPGLCKQAMTDACHYHLNFPVDLDIKLKATLLGALFLIDFMYGEKPK